MKILIVNDDSIHAPGIELLARLAMSLGDVWVVAPSEQCSAMSQRISIHGKLKVEKAENFPVPVKEAWQVGGTPADCVKVALRYILKEKPDVVFSGINNGYNVGFDIAYSGTLGAAFEAVRNGIPAIAFSVSNNSWLETAEVHLPKIMGRLVKNPLPAGEVWNVNIPGVRPSDVKGILEERTAATVSMYCEEYEETVLPDGNVELTIYGKLVSDDRIPAGSDAKAVRDGYISIGTVKAF